MNTIFLRPLSRVEGRGEVRLHLEGDDVRRVELRLTEPPRLFESLLRGRRVDEVPNLVARICAICAVPHAVAAALALERALGLAPPPAAQLVRELALLGNLVQSHALHLFALVLPDLRDAASLPELLRRDDRDARDGLALRAFGNRVQEATGGRPIHPVALQLGGVLTRPDADTLSRLGEESRAWQARVAEWTGLFAGAPDGPRPRPARGVPLATAGAEPLAHWGDALRGGAISLPVANYRGWLREETPPDGNAKQVRAPVGCWRTGALARRQLAGTSEERTDLGIFAGNLAQLEEISLALARIATASEALRTLPPSALLQVTPSRQSGHGTVALEAPRGTLIHHYRVDDGGRISAADIITPTTINQVAMVEQLHADLADGGPPEQLKSRAEQTVRAFDPCISCAVHLVRT